MSTDPVTLLPVLEAVLNQSRVHKEHERFYSSAPLETALRLQRHARALQALADRWAAAAPSDHTALSPYEGADDLNSEAAIALENRSQVLAVQTQDMAEALSAFREKRVPQFHNR